MSEATIRDELPADAPRVAAVELEAFGQPGEAALVAALRPVSGVISLVAEAAGAVVGHLVLSPVEVAGPQPSSALALGPMAVLPRHQRGGIGGALISAAIERAREAGAPAVIVLGHPDYYPRFGFVPTGPQGLRCKWPVPAEAYMVLELEEGWVARQGNALVTYDDAFDSVT